MRLRSWRLCRVDYPDLFLPSLRFALATFRPFFKCFKWWVLLTANVRRLPPMCAACRPPTPP